VIFLFYYFLQLFNNNLLLLNIGIEISLDGVSSLLLFIGVDISAGFNGWSLKTLKGVVAEAGAHLETFTAELSETGKEHTCLFLLTNW
jgi:hypothetical protein